MEKKTIKVSQRTVDKLITNVVNQIANKNTKYDTTKTKCRLIARDAIELFEVLISELYKK
jgi:hypothetical protein